jgi:hypothetical protein
MKKFSRFILLTVLGAFLGLTAAQDLHAHAAAPQETACGFCKIAHQTPVISAEDASFSRHEVSETLHTQAVVVAASLFLIDHPGRSPPLA